MAEVNQQKNLTDRDRLTRVFIEQHGRECAYIPFARWQRHFYRLLLASWLIFFLWRWDLFILALTTLASGWYLAGACFKGLAALRSLRGDGVERVDPRDTRALTDAELPVYTVLVPLYHEANIAERIVHSIERLDYPPEKLDVKLLLEADDQETQRAVESCDLPACCEVIVVPDGHPRTKPRACNYGLESAKGKYCVIYDAEDRPDPDQLRKAVVAFARLPGRVVCLQAALNYFNSRQNWLTRWFTIEYSTTFDLYLPGVQTLGVPVPLGGTSNHFRTEALKEIGGWDPFNVTEDCDLGIRLYKKGYTTRMLDSTTWEEANCEIWNWVRQRSRWVKGFMQTHLVHMRHPLMTARELGVRGLAGFYMAVGAGSFMMIVNVFYWMLGGVYLGLLWHGHQAGLGLWDMIHGPHEAGLYRGIEIGGAHLQAWPLVFFGKGESLGWTALSVSLFIVSMSLLAANFFFILIHVVACVRRRTYRLIPMALLMPVYWVLISIGAWKGGLQLLTRPFFWEKTNHGLDVTPRRGLFGWLRYRLAAGVRRSATLLAFLLLTAALVAREPGWYAGNDGYQRLSSSSAASVTAEIQGKGLVFLQHDRHTFRASRAVFDAARLTFEIPSVSAPVTARVFVQDRDGLWFQSRHVWDLRPGEAAKLSVPLSRFEHAFEPKGHTAQWQAGDAVDILSLGVSLESEGKNAGAVRITCCQPKFEGTRERRPLKVDHWVLPGTVPQRRMSESRFDLTREYFNPFDPGEIRVDVEILDPTGKRSVHPAFFGMDCRRTLVAGKEVVNPAGVPYWAYRFTPTVPGIYGHRLLVEDWSSEKPERITTPWRVCEARAGDAPGFVQVDPGQTHNFRFENGELFYPVGLNLHAIYDPRGSAVLGEGLLPDYGTYSYDDFFEKMGAAGMSETEIWMASWSMGLEWSSERRGYRGLGRYNMQNAWRLDYLIAAAARRGIYIHLVLDCHGKLSRSNDQEWLESPFNLSSPFAVADGAFLSDPAEFFTSERAWKLTCQRNRYIAARWGQNPTIFGMELWSEVDLIERFRNLYQSGALIDWTKKTIWRLRADGLRQLMTTHVSGNAATNVKFPKLQQLPEIDYVVGDAYRNPTVSMLDQLQLQDTQLRIFDKPRLITEYGGSWAGASYSELEGDLHAGLWGSLFTRQAGAPMLWWHAFIHYKCGYDHYRVFAAFMDGIDPRKDGFSYASPPLKSAGTCQAFAAGTPVERYVWVANKTYMKNFPSRSQRARIKTAAASVVLSGLKPGPFTVQWWNPMTGILSEETVTVPESGAINLRLPPFSTDVAAKMFHRGEKRGGGE